MTTLEGLAAWLIFAAVAIVGGGATVLGCERSYRRWNARQKGH
jgi:hypothetical protein